MEKQTIENFFDYVVRKNISKTLNLHYVAEEIKLNSLNGILKETIIELNNVFLEKIKNFSQLLYSYDRQEFFDTLDQLTKVIRIRFLKEEKLYYLASENYCSLKEFQIPYGIYEHYFKNVNDICLVFSVFCSQFGKEFDIFKIFVKFKKEDNVLNSNLKMLFISGKN